MPDSAVNIRPNATNTNVGFSLQGGSTIHGNLSDDSESTAARNNAVGDNIGLGMTDPSIPAGSVIKYIVPACRAYAFTGGTANARFKQWMRLSNINYPWNPPEHSVPNSPVSLVWGTPIYTKEDGTAFTTADLNAMEFWLQALTSAPQMAATEAYITVVYNQRPVSTISSPAAGATVTDTRTPTITMTYSDPENDAKERHVVKIFSGTGTVTDPETETARLVWSSGEVLTSSLTQLVGASLADGGYTVAVKQADAGSNGRYSAWVTSTFTISVTSPTFASPATPTVSVATDATNVRNTLTITPQGSVMTDYFEVERSYDAGVTWERVTGGDKVDLPNLLTENESDIETDATGWSSDTGNQAGYPQRTTGAAVKGSAALLLQRDSGSGGAGTIVSAILARYASAVAGRRYMAWLAANPVTTVRNVTSDLSWFNASQALISTSVGATVAETANQWQWAFVDAVAPANTTSFRHRMRVIDPAASEQHRFDSMKVAEVPVTYYDYEAQRLRSARYRVRSVRVAGTNTMRSDWATTGDVTMAHNGATMLKSPTDPTLNMRAPLATDLESSSEESQGVFSPIGRSEFTVIGSDIGGEHFELEFHFLDDVAWNAFETLRKRRETLLLQTRYGDTYLEQYWIRFGQTRKVRRMGSKAYTGESTKRIVTIDAYQVKRPK